MVPIDMNRVHLFMGLTHPVFGPMNMAVYSTAMASAMSYAWYQAWAHMVVDAALAASPPSQK